MKLPVALLGALALACGSARAQLATIPVTPAATVNVTPAVQAASYAAGASVGGLLAFPVTRSTTNGGLVQSVVVTFTGGATPTLDLVLFSAKPGASTITDKAAISIAAADLGKVVGVIHISDCTLLGTSAPSACQSQQQATPVIVATNGAPIYATVITRSSLTPTSTADMTVSLQVLQN